MGEESGGEVKGTIDAVTGLVKAVPVYEDLLQPVAKQLGKSLETVGKAINVALFPVSSLVWGYENIQVFLSTKLADRLKDVPPEDIITPKPNVAGPAMDALRYTGHEDTLSDMYANLLASAMDRSTAKGAHPAFVEIIKQLTPDEAKILSLFISKSSYPVINLMTRRIDGKGGSEFLVHYCHLGKMCGLDDENLIPAYLDNFCRLGLMAISPGVYLTADGVYDALENDPVILQGMKVIERDPARKPGIDRLAIRATEMGRQFINACVKQKTAQK